MDVKQRELYKRLSDFAIGCANLVGKLDWRIPSNKVWGNQLIRSSGSIGANFIEAVESVSRREFIYRLSISRREANESVHWLYLLEETNEQKSHSEIRCLIKESREFVKIFTSSMKTARSGGK